MTITALIFLALALQGQPPPNGAPVAYRAASDIALFNLKNFVKPQIPEGVDLKNPVNVVYQIAISPEGKVADLKLITPEGPLADVAQAAIRNWTFEPFRLKGKKIDGNLVAPVGITFQTRDKKRQAVLLFPFGEFASEGAAGPAPARPIVQLAEMEARRISAADPNYPEDAKQRRIQGTVRLSGIVAKDGTVKALRPMESPDSLLTNAAIEAVKRWTYRPYAVNGNPVEVETEFKVTFSLGI